MFQWDFVSLRTLKCTIFLLSKIRIYRVVDGAGIDQHTSTTTSDTEIRTRTEIYVRTNFLS